MEEKLLGKFSFSNISNGEVTFSCLKYTDRDKPSWYTIEIVIGDYGVGVNHETKSSITFDNIEEMKRISEMFIQAFAVAKLPVFI